MEVVLQRQIPCMEVNQPEFSAMHPRELAGSACGRLLLDAVQYASRADVFLRIGAPIILLETWAVVFPAGMDEGVGGCNSLLSGNLLTW